MALKGSFSAESKKVFLNFQASDGFFFLKQPFLEKYSHAIGDVFAGDDNIICNNWATFGNSRP